MSCVGSTNSNHSGHAGNAGHILIGTPQSPLAPSSQSGLDVSLLRDFQGPNYDKGLVARDYSNTIGSRTGSRLDISASEHHRDSSENQPKKLGVGAVTGLISSGCSTDTEETGTNEMDLASSLEGQERRGLVEDFVDRSFGKESLGKGVIDALRKYIVEQDSVISNKEDCALVTPVAVASASSSESGKSAIRVKYSKVPFTLKKQRWIYPFNQLKTKTVTYRGYPMNGPAAFAKSKKWKIQLVGSALDSPSEPLPQFPQQELLSFSPGRGYYGVEKMNLTEEQVSWNSGYQYRQMSSVKTEPTSESFYTSGYYCGSAVKVMKPFPQSIYHTVVSGSTVEVPIYSYPSKST